MRELSGLTVAAMLTVALSGCAGPGGFGLLASDGREQQALVDPAAGNTPPATDETGAAKRHFRDREFGLAEQAYRSIIERAPENVEAWLGLAATHDQLGRYDLADREYAQVSRRGGATFELLNNRGYSYLMRGDLRRARRDFESARKIDPDNEFLRNNLRELDEKSSGRG